MSGLTVALVGADGAGKSTVARRLAATLPMPAAYIYMGDNLESANHMLPTTRLLRALARARGRVAPAGPPDPQRALASRARRRGPGAAAKRSVRRANHLLEECYRQALAWSYARAGRVVIFDRYLFADYYAHDIAPAEEALRTPWRRFHGALLRAVHVRPDLVVCLDAPAAVLLRRKGEGTLELLERRRREYFAIQPHVRRFAVVDATQPLDHVVREVAALVESLRASPRRPG